LNYPAECKLGTRDIEFERENDKTLKYRVHLLCKKSIHYKTQMICFVIKF